MTEENMLADLLASLDAVVLRRVEAGVFELLGPCPEWLAGLCPELRDEATLRPGDRFPFLEAFMYDAEPFWEEHESGRVKSGPFIEVDEAGEQVYLEASAVSLGPTKLLLLESPKIAYKEHLATIQTGRETSLERDRMLREIQKKEILLHCIVHDLKGPLTGIVGSVSLIAGKETLPGQKEFLEMALRQAGKLEMLIAGILGAFSAEIEALESFVFDPNEAPDAVAVATDAAMAMAPAFRLAKAALELDDAIEQGGDWRVVADKARLERVLSNLIGNALRYSPRGSTVKIGLTRDDEWVTFSIDDEGPGVPPDVADRLFQKFSQGKTGAGSAGLGLYFCRMTVERWGGTIGYTPRPEGGSRFWFKLRRASAFHAEARSE